MNQEFLSAFASSQSFQPPESLLLSWHGGMELTAYQDTKGLQGQMSSLLDFKLCFQGDKGQIVYKPSHTAII